VGHHRGADHQGQPVDGIFGYSPKSATQLMAALLVYAGQ
jgi:hypothetical protein